MAKVLEALISKGRRVRRAVEQKEVAFGLADLSTHEELLERMVQKGSVKSLLHLLTKSTDRDARRFSSLALANLSSAAFNRTRVASEGTIPILINLMKDVDSDVVSRQYCAMALGNLAAEPDNHLEIVKSDGIEAFLAVLRTDDVDAGRYAAFGLANIGANANHRDRIVELGSVPNLISLACSEDINAQRQALAGLRSICIAPEFRAVVVREGIMDPLVLLSRVEDVGILREVASAVNCLSSVEENKLEISDRAMSTIIGLMLSGDLVIERHSVCAAANLMEMLELHVKLSEERGIAPIVAIAASKDPNSRGEACRCLANLSVNPDMHQIIIREGSLGPLVGALTLQELNCQRYASLCLANLSTTVAAQIKIIQTGAVKPLIDLGMNPLHQIEARRYAALALANLTATAANHMTIIEDGGLQAFFSLCNSPDLMSQYYVGCALANLSCSIANHFIIVEQGGLQALITLVSSKDPDVHQQAAAALRGLAVTAINKMKIVQEGALGPLTLLLSSEDVEILREVVACFCNLSVSEENKLEIVKCWTVSAFISLSQSADMVVASMACATLANLAEIRANQDLIAAEGAIRPTISVMRSKYIEVQREAGRLLANLCSSTADNTVGVIEAGGHSLLISYLLSQDTACQRVGSMGICNLCTQPRFRKTLMECGVVEPLCALARSEDVELEIQRYAILAIANLASATEIHHLFIEEGMLALLISLSTSNDAEVRQYSSYAVTKIAQNADVRKAVTDEGGLEPVLYLARTDEEEIQKEVLPALCSLSFSDANKVAICRNGGLDSIVSSILDPSPSISRLACCTIANLAEIVENFDRIYDAAASPALVKALAEGNDEVKREAARAIGNLAANIELADEFLREGAISHLLPMIRSDETLTQRMGAFALSNLSANVRDHSIMMSGGMFEVLLVEITQALDPKSRSDYECTRYCLLVITNLAVSVSNHAILMKQALPILSQFSKHRDIKCRQHALYCIANLCSNKDNIEDIIATGCLRTVITYAFPSSDSSANVQFQAVAALRGMATHPLIRIQIVREGALEPLIICARSPSIEVQRETAATLCNIALAEENKVILARGGALPALISLSMSGDRQREAHAAAALANIAEMVEGRTQERMIDEGVLKPLLRLSESDDPEIRREVARAFALFASKRDSHTALVRVHAAVKMTNFLADNDETCKRYGTLGIGNLAVSRDTHQELFDVGAIQRVQDVVTSTDLSTRRAVSFTFNNISSNPNNHSACERLGIIRSIIVLLKDHDKDTNLQATIAMRNLCESARCRHQFIELNGIAALLNLGTSEDIEVKREVAAVLRNLSLSEHCKISIVEAGGLTILCDMLNHSDIEICHQTAGVIANLAEATENQGIMVEHGLIQHIKYIMRSKSIDIQREGARAMANISAEYSFTSTIVAAGALLSLITTLSSPDFLCQRYAVMGVGNLASNPVNQKKIVQEGGVPPLISLSKFDNGDLESQKYAVIALANLSATKSNHSIMIDIGCLDLMKMLLHHENQEIRSNAIFFIANLASNPVNHVYIMRDNCMKVLVALLLQELNIPGPRPSDFSPLDLPESPRIKIDDNADGTTKKEGSDTKSQLRILSCIRGFSTDANIRLDLLELNILQPLLILSKSSDLDIQMEALACLCNMSLCGCIGEDPNGFLDAITVRNLIAFLCSADTTYRLFGAVAIGNIASSQPLQQSLLNGGALAPLISVANAADLETQRCIAYALCNLASDSSRRHDIVREGGLPSIISMACSDDVVDQLAALSTLRGIASQPENCRAVFLANILEAISIGTKASLNMDHNSTNEGSTEGDEIEIKCEVSSLLCALSINEENKIDMINQSVILECLTSILRTSSEDKMQDVRYLRPAIACLANFSEKIQCHEKLCQYQVHHLVLNHFNHTDVPLVREVTRILANLSSVFSNHEPLIAGNCIIRLIDACQYDDVIISRFGTLALLNFATREENHLYLMQNNVQTTLIQLSRGSKKKWNHLDRLGNIIDSAVHESDGQVMKDRYENAEDTVSLRNLQAIQSDAKPLTLREFQESPRSIRDSLFVDSFGYDKETRRYAILALGCLALSEATHPALLSDENGLLETLGDALVSVDFETRFNATFTLNKLSNTNSNVAALGRDSLILNRLVNLISNAMTIEVFDKSSESYDMVGQLLGALRRLAKDANNRTKMVSFNILDPLANIASKISSKINIGKESDLTTELEILRELSTLCCELTLSENMRSTIVGSSVLVPLVELCSMSDVEISRQACGAVANLAESKRTHKRLATVANTMNIMVCVMKSKHLSVHREASRAVANMLSSTAFHKLFLDEGGLSSLFRLCKSLDIETLYNCSLIFRKLSPILTNHDHIIGKGGLVNLLNLTKTHDVSVNRQAAAALRDISSNPQHKIILAEEGCLKRAIELARDVDNELRTLGVCIMRHLSVHSRIKAAIIEQDGLTSLFLAIDSDTTDSDLLRQCSATLSYIAENIENQVILVQNKILPRLVRLSNSSDMETLCDVAKCFASISSNPSNTENVFDIDNFLAVIRIMTKIAADLEKSDDNQNVWISSTETMSKTIKDTNQSEAKGRLKNDDQSISEKLSHCAEFLLLTAGNLAMSEKNHKIMVRVGVLPLIHLFLTKFTASHERIYEYACRSLYRLASSDASIQIDIVQQGIVSTLNKLCLGNNPTVRKYIIMTLCNLSTNSSGRQQIAESGSLFHLLKFLYDSEEIAIKYSIQTIINLLQESATQRIIAELGGIGEIVNLASSRKDLSRYAAMAISNLSSHQLNRIKVVQWNALSPVVKLAYSRSQDIQRIASLTLYNVSGAAVNHLVMTKAEVVPAITNLAKSSDILCRRYAIMTLGNLAATTETRASATRTGGLQTAIAFLKDEDEQCRQYACVALCNMATSALTQEQLVVHGALPTLISMARDNGDKESQRQALLTLNNVAANELNHSTLLHKDVMTTLLHVFEGDDVHSKEYAAFVIANMCGNPDYLAMIGRLGGIAPLIMLSKSKNKNSCCLGISSLRRLADNEDNWSRLNEAGLLESLAAAGYSSESDIQKEVAACLCALSLSKPHRLQIARTCLSTMVNLVYSGESDVVRQIVGTLANLAEDITTHENIAQAHGLHCFLVELNDANVDVRREASRGIANIASSFRHQQEIINSDNDFDIPQTPDQLSSRLMSYKGQRTGISGILSLIFRADDEDCILHAAIILRKLAPNLASHRAIIQNDGYKALFQLLVYSNPGLKRDEIRKYGASALRDISANPEFKLRCFEEGAVQELIALARDEDEELQTLAYSTLRHLSLAHDIRDRIFSTDPKLSAFDANDSMTRSTNKNRKILRCIMKASKIPNEDLHAQIAGFLANMSESMRNQSMMIEEGMATCLFNLAFTTYDGNKSAEVQQDVARAFIHLSSNETIHKKIYSQGALHVMLHLSASDQTIAQGFASMGIRFLVCNPEIRSLIVKDGHIDAFIALASKTDLVEYRRTAAAAFASFSLHEENKGVMVRQLGCLSTLFSLVQDPDKMAQQSAAFAIANLCEGEDIQDDLVAAGVLEILIRIANESQVQRDVARAFSLLSQFEDIQLRMLRHEHDPVLSLSSSTQVNDASTETANASIPIITALMKMSTSRDVPCQRYATLALANICSCTEFKVKIMECGIIPSLLFLSHAADLVVKKYSSLAMAGLALGGYGTNKQMIVTQGCVRPLVEILQLKDITNQIFASIALNCLVLGNQLHTKSIIMSENGLEELLKILSAVLEQSEANESIDTNRKLDTIDLVASIAFSLGSLCEHEDVMRKLVDLGAIDLMVKIYHHMNQFSRTLFPANSPSKSRGDAMSWQTNPSETNRPKSIRFDDRAASIVDIRRSVGYLMASICEHVEYHAVLFQQKAVELIISLASLEDIECQEYAAFCLAHLSSNCEYQVMLVDLNAVKPLVAMISSDAEPKHYAGLALLKLADNFDNHMKIAEAGGIQALLRLGRTKSSDEQLQYKAALAVGQLASNALRFSSSPSNRNGPAMSKRLQHALPSLQASGTKRNSTDLCLNRDNVIGRGARMLNQMRIDANAEIRSTKEYPSLGVKRSNGADIVSDYLNKSLKAIEESTSKP